MDALLFTRICWVISIICFVIIYIILNRTRKRLKEVTELKEDIHKDLYKAREENCATFWDISKLKNELNEKETEIDDLKMLLDSQTSFVGNINDLKNLIQIAVKHYEKEHNVTIQHMVMNSHEEDYANVHHKWKEITITI